jgi:hypothetical protein
LSGESSNKTFLVVGVIFASAASLSFISYHYSTAASARILDLAVEDARSNAEIQAHDLSALLGKQIESVDNNLQTIASSRSIQNQELERVIPLLSSAQKSTTDITSAYSWLDKDGEVLWATSFSDPELERQFAGADFSYREYYLKPRETLSPYYSTLFENVEGNTRLTISYPIIIGETPTEANNEETNTDSASTFN